MSSLSWFERLRRRPVRLLPRYAGNRSLRPFGIHCIVAGRARLIRFGTR